MDAGAPLRIQFAVCNSVVMRYDRGVGGGWGGVGSYAPISAAVAGVVFYSTPHFGSWLAQFPRWVAHFLSISLLVCCPYDT